MSKTLDINDLLKLINNLSTRITTLEEQNIELTKKIDNIQKNDSNKTASKIVEQLNNKPIPSLLYNEWIEQIFLLIPSKLEIVFENDLLKGICNLFKESIENFDSIPICAYNKKKLLFYYYNEETEKWEILENKDFDELISRICYRFLAEFKRCWYDVNIHKINTQEEYTNLYNSYYLKILGGDKKISNESFNNRIKTYFYSLIKEKI